MDELKIVAKIVVKEEFRAEMMEALNKIVSESRKEEGNISYDLFRSVHNPLEYTIIETWKSQEAIDFHNNTPHFLGFKDEINGKTDSLVIDVLKAV